MSDPASLALPPPLAQALAALSFDALTPVQAQALPALLDGRDVIAQARTGSGKTVAFGLGLLARIDAAGPLQALVLVPTRELADQVGKALRQLARFLPNLKLSILCGGVPLRVQLESLVHMPQIVVGTPGRILEHLEKGSLELSALRVLVLDEADRMLDMGFVDAMRNVVRFAPRDCQTSLFSATFPEEIRALSREFQREPFEVQVDDGSAATEIVQRFYEVDTAQKLDALAWLLAEHKPASAMIFCNTRRDTQDVAAALDQRGWSVLALHGDLEQRDRDEVLVRFANRSCSLLVATDVAARGLDIADLELVILYDMASDADTYVHRVGRTGRAGRSGLALTLYTPREQSRVDAVAERLGRPLSCEPARTAPARLRSGQLAPMQTLVIDAGRKDKLRPADILGALTGTAGIPGTDVGKIAIFDTRSYVAVTRGIAEKALQRLREGKIKGRSLRVRKLG
ncbi:MAG: ATP-dependent RNA helicase DbpA [Lysobacterales bacterium 69-70]|nr:MAG: ATP-dependent RNA helicase DbpA [Xanthomonadaceae bacterium SCN 69-320]ODV16162.1 MAG: ATP-dependent RNA helicase DbpA [Xanthomonadaceae bacterium SCN 69-25]OJY98928.1 MAG: ATP-dependent RNA helicase DbpA [Xanthomonadales bacterium 69-70]